MTRRPWLLGSLVACALVLAACGGSKSGATKPVSCKVGANLASGCGVWWGAFVSPTPGIDDTSTAPVLELEHQVGRKLAIVHRYHDMSSGARGRFPDAAERALGKDRLLFIAWASREYGGIDHTWRDIADGAIDDSVIDPAARRVAAYGKRIFLDFDHEPEAHPENGSDAEFVAAYRHIHDRFLALGVENVEWVWTVTGFKSHWDRYQGLYPGDDVVDWVAWDPYDFNTCRSAGHQSPKQVIDPFYDWLEDHHPTKPFMLAEYGTVPDQADPQQAADWYRDLVPVLKDRPKIRAAVLFDHYPGGATGTGCDTRLHPAPVLQGWADAGRDPYVNPPRRG